MSVDLIRYDLQVQDALRGVVRNILSESARKGLPGEHHFYITFSTQAAGVKMSSRLREQYPEEMVIVLQHQFWDLNVDEEGFEVGLHFKNVPERLGVPFSAITGFFDPSVQFGLKFEVQDAEADVEESVSLALVAPPLEKPRPRGAGSEPTLTIGAPMAAKPAAAEKTENDDKKAEPVIQPSASESSNDPAKVVSIDAFRKKT